MVLTGKAKTVYQREYMRWRRGVVVPGKCEACNKGDYIQAHHPDYNKPAEVLWVCASCHKKLHLHLAGKQRTTSKPYINPLDKIAIKPSCPPGMCSIGEVKHCPCSPFKHIVTDDGEVVEFDADGNRIYDA